MHHLGTRRRGLVISYGVLVISVFVFFAPLALAQPAPAALPAPGTASGLRQAAAIPGQAGLVLTGTDPRIIAAKIIRVALGFLGTVALVLVLYGGYLWMTAVGNEEQIDKAKKLLTQAVIGLVIILTSFAIVQFVINKLLAEQSAPPLPPPRAAQARVGGGALGSGIIESHFPGRGAVNIARNTRIVVSFKERIDPASLAEVVSGAPSGTRVVTQTPDGAYHYPTVMVDHDDNPATPLIAVSALRLRWNNSGDGIPNAVQIIKNGELNGSVRGSNGTKYVGSKDSQTDVLVSFTEDLRTFIFTPVEQSNHARRAYLGSATDKTLYSIYLCGTSGSKGNCASDGIKLLAGPSAFQGVFKDYQWSFETGTFLDVTPPQVQSVLPFPDNVADAGIGNCPGTNHSAPCDRPDRPRNSMVQINFDEAVLPTVVSGTTRLATPADYNGPLLTRGSALLPGTFEVLRVREGINFIAGDWQIGNQYRTSEFISKDLCGRNSCGEDVFCLPAESNIEVQVLAASLETVNAPESAGRFDGVEDMAGNSLDGNGNGRAQGPGIGQDYRAARTFFNKNYATAADPGDNLKFSFYTSQDLLLSSALITRTAPNTTYGDATANVPLASFPEMEFNRAMAKSSLSSRNLNFSGHDKVTGGMWDTWWIVESENLPEDVAYLNGRTLARVIHGGLWKEADYINTANSQVRDLYQNCYYPGGGSGIVRGDQTVACNVILNLEMPYCCVGVPCAAGDVNCKKCGFN